MLRWRRRYLRARPATDASNHTRGARQPWAPFTAAASPAGHGSEAVLQSRTAAGTAAAAAAAADSGRSAALALALGAAGLAGVRRARPGRARGPVALPGPLRQGRQSRRCGCCRRRRWGRRCARHALAGQGQRREAHSNEAAAGPLRARPALVAPPATHDRRLPSLSSSVMNTTARACAGREDGARGSPRGRVVGGGVRAHPFFGTPLGRTRHHGDSLWCGLAAGHPLLAASCQGASPWGALPGACCLLRRPASAPLGWMGDGNARVLLRLSNHQS